MANWRAVLGLVLNALVWGVSWWPFRQLQEQGLHPLWSTALIYLLALLALLALRPGALRVFLQQRALWLLALAAGLTNLGFNWAVTVGDVVRVALLFYLMPAWMVLLAWPLLGERPGGAALGRLLLALCSVVLVLTTPTSTWPLPKGLVDWLALLAGLAFALTNISLRRLHGTAPSACMLAMFIGSACLATGTALVAQGGGMVPALPSAAPGWLAGVVALCALVLVANIGLQYGASRLPAHVTGLVMLSELVFASGSSVLLGASELTLRMVAGGCLIVLAALLSAWSTRDAPQATAP